jgi:protein TonB
MAKSADKVVSLAELRFKPANSNDAARAVFSRHFDNVPRCSFACDDGISPYLGSETGMENFPASPEAGAPANIDVPAIQGETPVASGSFRRKLLRSGFALSVFLHAAAAIAVGYATLALPDDAVLEEGALSVTLMVEGNAEADARAAGAQQQIEKSEDKPAEKEPIERPEVQTPVRATTETILKDVPMPVVGTNLPDILTAKTEAETKTETAAKPPTEEKVENPVEKPVEQARRPVGKKPIEQIEKPVEKQPAEPKRQPEKEKPRQKHRQNRGDQASNARKGDVDSRNKGKASTNSRGAAAHRETGNASKSNYKGLVSRKLSRAKGRMASPAKGKLWVTFTILSDGSISGLSVTQSSGKPAVDATALKIVRAASPFPPIPAETGLKRWKMTVPMTFKGSD